MDSFDTVIRGGTIVTAADSTQCDVGIRGGRITALAQDLPVAGHEIDARGKLVLPGGVEGHCHIEQESSVGNVMSADDFFTGTRSAVFGGTTTTLSFAAQMKGQSLRKVVDDYHALAASKAVIDYGFHLIVSDPTEQTMNEHLPALIKEGMTSFKVYMTYDSLKLDDHQMLDVLATARQHGAMVMIHAENHDMIRWLTQRLLQGGYDAPKFHAISHVELAEDEATHRAIRLSELIDVPILIVHVSASEAMAEIRRAQTAGLKVYGETCPQYLFLTASDLDREGAEGAKYCCSPPPRDASHHDIIWQGLANGTFQVFSSDHAPYRFDETGKLAAGPNPTFPQVANGVPGIELRLPLLFSEGVGKGRIDIQQFVALTSTNVAKIYGLLPRKGTIAVGSDADIAIWDPDLEVTVTWDLLHDNVGYTPYEGRKLRGWPVTVLSRGRVAVEDSELKVERGSGQFLPRYLSDAAQPLNRLVPEMDINRNFGAKIL
ncbi:MAG: dihydropyrimidinase [Acidiferrobacteraceae bacterium]|nr:dihydropyrimidinase [Acidiferrobacteraceae bacterium]